MSSFDYFWQLVETHGVVERHKGTALELWKTYSLEQQRAIYRSIRDKIQLGRFVHYNPVLAIKENAPKQPKQQTLSYADYYRTFGTTEEQGGWKRVYMANEQKTIYVKN